MSFTHSSIAWSTKQISAMVKSGKINLNHIIQRSDVWEKTRKSLLIHSIIMEVPVPALYAKKVAGNPDVRGDNTYMVLDGAQRCYTISEFLNDEYALSEIPEVVYYDSMQNTQVTEDISGKKFSELSEGLKTLISSTTVNIIYFDNLTKEEEKELFKRLNNGKPLDTKNKLLANCNDLELLMEIGSHSIFSKMFSEKALASKRQIAVVMKAWLMLNKPLDEISFEAKRLNPLIEEADITEDDRKNLQSLFDYADEVYEAICEKIRFPKKGIAKKFIKETNFVSMIPFLDQSRSPISYGEFMVFFFENEEYMEEYKKYSSNGSAKPANIIGRAEVIEKACYEYFDD